MASTKRKLLFDYYSDDPDQISQNGVLKKKIEKLKQNKVKTVFIITSREILLEPYLKLVGLYEENGLDVNSINIEAFDDDHLLFIKNAVEDINVSFRQGNCLIVSFGDSVAGPLLASFYLYSGKDLDNALSRVRMINDSLIQTDQEVSFLRKFQSYISGAEVKAEESVAGIQPDGKTDDGIKPEEKKEIHKIYPEKEPEIITERKETVKESKESVKKKDKDEKDEESTEEDNSLPELKGFGRFYTGIRFKLVTITSLIVILSLSGMIFLATYFFKRDNTVRVQENNLYVSEIVALKVKSDFRAIIDKSKLMANTLMQNIGNRNLDYYSDLLLNNDRDFIFFGMAVSSGSSSLNFTKKAYNKPLMDENGITVNEIEAVGSINNIYRDSFAGETVIHNISTRLQIPAISICIPFHKSSDGRIQSVLVCYLKLDRFLEAFQSSGITKMFMVDSKGDILAHPDSAIILGGGNYLELPIVKSMIKSTLPNGFQRYKDETGLYHLGSFNKIGIGGSGVIATVAENIAYQEVYNQQRRNIYLTIVVLTVAVLIIFFFGKTLTTPIVRLLGATKKIKNGDYNVKIRPAFKDEIGELTYAFIEMGQGLEEREKIKTAFGKFVNPELAEMVTKNEVKLGGERKTVAILFSDIRSFTSISEKLQPEEVVEFLNEYMTIMVECIDRTGGVVDKFIGDAIMAEWGIPASRGNDTENAINAALMMRKVLLEFNKDRGGDKKPVIRIGIGINTGAVLAGQIGSEDRMEYTVIGDAVNLASRIEALNKPFGTDVLISEDTYNLVKDLYTVEKMSPIRVKGKEEPQQIFAVLGRTNDPLMPKNIHELRDLLGTKEQPFRRRREDKDQDEKTEKQESEDSIEEEVKYEILA
ncbi:MAG: HAMP domain-containing protein [Spirochaetes bacterium]|nr:HAMP domain-containing protein [Spirochaetota bacterium]